MILGWKRSAFAWRCFQGLDPGPSLNIPSITHTLTPEGRHPLILQARHTLIPQTGQTPQRQMTPHPDLTRQKQVRNVLQNLCMVSDHAWEHLDGWILIMIIFVCLSSCSPVSHPVVVQFNMQTKIKANIQPSRLFKTGQKGYLMWHSWTYSLVG